MRNISLRAPRFLALLAMLTGTTASLTAQNPAGRIADDVRYLADDRQDGRGVGTAGLDSAAAYVARAFRDAGLTPGGSDGFLQPFTIDATAPAAAHTPAAGARVANVVGIVPGSGRLARQFVVVGAHYDHLGRGGLGSLDPDSVGVVHNGADDNASGTAAVMAIARDLVRRRAPNARSVIFLAFTAEELGLIGSAYYVRHPTRPIDSTAAMVNLDMVGRLKDNRLAVFGTATAPEFRALLDSLNQRHRLTLVGSGDSGGWGRSDQSSFFAAKVPVLHLFTGVHEDYHRTTDDWPKINQEGTARVAAFAADLAWALATRPEPLTFVDAPPPPPMAGGGGYGAYLGTIPDMTESPGGVRLTGVRSGSPAEAAGIRAGDILIRLGDKDVKNLYDMTAALQAHQPGDEVAVVVLRDGTQVNLRATLGRRGG